MDVQQHKIAYITGSSKGIGRALTDLLLSQDYFVVGLSRSNSIEHPNFKYQQMDMADLQAVKDFEFEIVGSEVLLVNNAGLIGEIGAVGSIENSGIENVINVNTIAPQILTNSFIKRFKNVKGQFHVLNISSGAGKNPIDAWATYCASKAALDLFSETVAEELDWRGHENWNVHSCAPGVVDTGMQEQIRSVDITDFKLVQKFKDLKENNELSTPVHVAKKLWEVISNPAAFDEIVISVRDF